VIHVMRARDLIGLPVVSVRSGEDIAEIRDVVYDSGNHRLLGFSLNKRGFFSGRLKGVLPTGPSVAIGSAAVMVSDDSVISNDAIGLEPLLDPASDLPVIGVRVLTSDGVDLGVVAAVIVTTGDAPKAVGYEIEAPAHHDTLFVPISAQLQLSDGNLMLPAEATDFIRNDLAGFGAAIASYRLPILEGDSR